MGSNFDHPNRLPSALPRLKQSSSGKAFTKRFDPAGRTLRNSSDGCRP